MRQRDMARLDREIAGLLGWTTVRGSDTHSLGVDPSTRMTDYIPRYSLDLNAVAAACEEAGLQYELTRTWELTGYSAAVWTPHDAENWWRVAHATTPALALCLALRAALESKTD